MRQEKVRDKPAVALINKNFYVQIVFCLKRLVDVLDFFTASLIIPVLRNVRNLFMEVALETVTTIRPRSLAKQNVKLKHQL